MAETGNLKPNENLRRVEMVIAVLIDDMFEDVEYTAPAKAFAEAGHKIVTIGIKKGAQVKGKKNNTIVSIEKEVSEVNPLDYDALFIPGGYSPDRLRANEATVAFTKAFYESKRPLFVICHAPQILITADLLGGRKITGYKSIIQDIKNAGAEFIDNPVVVDENLISSRGPKDLPDFISASLNALK